MTTPGEEKKEKKEEKGKETKGKPKFKILNPVDPKVSSPVLDPECGRWDV